MDRLCRIQEQFDEDALVPLSLRSLSIFRTRVSRNRMRLLITSNPIHAERLFFERLCVTLRLQSRFPDPAHDAQNVPRHDLFHAPFLSLDMPRS